MLQRILGAILTVSMFGVFGAQAVPCAISMNESSTCCCCVPDDETAVDCTAPQAAVFTDGGCPCADKSSPTTVPQPSAVRSAGQVHETPGNVEKIARTDCFEPPSIAAARAAVLPPRTGPPRFIRHCVFLI